MPLGVASGIAIACEAWSASPPVISIPGIVEVPAAEPGSVFAAGIAIPSMFCAGMGVGDAAAGRGRDVSGLLVCGTGLACGLAIGFATGVFLGAGFGIAMPFMSIPCIDCADAAPAKASVVPTASAAKAMRFMPLLPVDAR
ncbi:hypothetical protein Sbs19_33440 [Sphingobium sp. BS19]|nr:hypothetical protein Sbs19_33440 [Sphingobium sp. BS19]